METTLLIATPEFFGEEKRMKGQMGTDKYRKNDPRVITHSNYVQAVRATSTAKDKKFWGDQAQTVKLPVKCEGPPMKKWTYIPVGMIETHRQFVMVLSIFYKVAKKRIEREKIGEVRVCAALDSDSEEEDVDEDKDAQEEAEEEDMNI